MERGGHTVRRSRKAPTRPRPPLACRWSGGGESGLQGHTAGRSRKAPTCPRPPLACMWSGGGESGPQGRTAQEANQTLLVLTLVDVEGCHVIHDDGAPEVLILILGLVSI